MSSESLTEETNSGRDARVKLLWILGVSGSTTMLYYEYLWSRFAVRNLASVSVGGWFEISFTIAAPLIFCFVCLFLLRDGARNGSVTRDVCLNISMLVELITVSAYSMLAAIHRLTALGVLK